MGTMTSALAHSSWLLTAVLLLLSMDVAAHLHISEEPSSPPSTTCERRRSLLGTCWGCISTIVALGADYFGVFWPMFHRITSLRKVFPVGLEILSVPLYYPSDLIRQAVQAWIVSGRIKRRIGQGHDSKEITARCKVLIACTVFIDRLQDSSSDAFFGALGDEVDQNDHSVAKRIEEALELPRLQWNKEEAKSRTTKHRLVKLNLAGKEWLLTSGLLPPFRQLKFLQTRNAIAIALSAIQAIGFLLVIVERFVQHQRVSPLEALATPMAGLVLLQAAVHRWATGSCQRSLLIHLQQEEEEEQDLTRLPHYLIGYKDYEQRLRIGIAFFLGSFLAGPTIAFGVYFLKFHCHHCTHVGAIAFDMAMVTYVPMLAVRRDTGWAYAWACITLSMLATSFVFAMIVTVMEWHTFSVEETSIIRYIIPHI